MAAQHASNYLNTYLETLHREYNPRDYFAEKLQLFRKQNSNFQKVLVVNEKALLASYKVVYKVAKSKRPQSIAEQLTSFTCKLY